MSNMQRIELRYPHRKKTSEILAKTESATLEALEAFGTSGESDWSNMLVHGDNLHVLQTLRSNPAVAGNVTLVYIDPPFATGRVFDENDDLTKANGMAFDDSLRGFGYIEFLRQRLVLIKSLMSKHGSIYLHIDNKMVHYVRIIMDEVFGERNFRSMIARQKCHPKGYTRNTYGNIHDYILYYSLDKKPIWNRPLDPMTPEVIKKSEYRYVEEETGRIYKKVPIHAPGIRNGATGSPWRGRKPPEGKHWQYTPEKLEGFDREGRIYWSATGNPRLKLYLDEREGVAVQDIWLTFPDPMNQFTAATDYPTEKNEEMLGRIVKASSNIGDIVLDCFAGSGTTLVAAESLGRRWIGIDNSELAVETTKKRILDLYNEDGQSKLISMNRFEVLHGK